MTVLCVVQARMGSSRLPGKVLMELDGRPMLRFMLDRLAHSDVPVVVATSERTGDDPVAECAAAADVAVVRGPEADVLGRFAIALERYPADHVVRLTADCPLIDPELIRAVADHHIRVDADYTSNTVIRTHPDGLDVEVVRAGALREAIATATDPDEREHVTPHFYRNPSRFRLAAVRSPDRLGHLRWTVDTAADLDVLRAMVGRHPGVLDWRELLAGLPPTDQARLTDGFEPAVAGETPVETLDDPADRVVSFRVDDSSVGWVRLTVADGGRVTLRGTLPVEHRPAAAAALPGLLAQTRQITAGDLSLHDVHT